MSYERNQEAWDALRSECDELAQTVEVMRDALHVAVETDQLQGGLWEERAVAALALPNTAAAILRQRDARTLRGVQHRAIPDGCNFATFGDVCRELERTIAELERKNG